jgi:pyruvyltransferase
MKNFRQITRRLRTPSRAGTLEEVERAREKLQSRLGQAKVQSVPLQRLKELERAEKDIHLIMERMSRSRVAPLLRLKEEFRVLEHRYLVKKARTIKLYWWQHQNPRIRNIGDELSPLLVEKLSGHPVEKTSVKDCNLVAIGSILEWVAAAQRDKPLWVWGSGFIKRGGKLDSTMLRCAAVRGPLSARRLVSDGRPPTLGDPGILADRLLRRPVQTRWEIGIVPHYVDLAHPLVGELRDRHNEAIVISPLLSPEVFVARIASCRVVLSSGLHGLIVADSLGIPNTWVEFSRRIIGRGYKYRDYLANFGITDPKPREISSADVINSVLIRQILSTYRRSGIEQMKRDLVAAFPPV